jgi:HEAT repeats
MEGEMTHPAGVLLLIVLLLWPLAGVSWAGENKSSDLLIRMEQNILTVKAREVPHRRILEGLARRLNFELIITGALEERRSLEIDGRPWEEALKRALSPASWAFVYDSSGTGEPRLAKVFVFAAKEGGSSPTRTPTTSSHGASPAAPADQTPEPQVPSSSGPAEKGIDASLVELLEADDDEMRALALVGLATMGGEQAVTALKQALQDKEPWIRETAVEALAEIGGEAAIQGLQQALRDQNVEVRKAAQDALARLQPSPK